MDRNPQQLALAEDAACELALHAGHELNNILCVLLHDLERGPGGLTPNDWRQMQMLGLRIQRIATELLSAGARQGHVRTVASIMLDSEACDRADASGGGAVVR